MKKTKIVTIVLPEMTDAQQKEIETTVRAYGYEPRFYASVSEAMETAKETEVLFSTSAKLTEAAENLRWQCSPSAGVNQFADCEAFRNGSAQLTCSSGAYGVTIAEHIIMLILEVYRRQPEYAEIVRERRWQRNLPMRSIRGSRIALLGTGDIGQTTVPRLRGFAPASVIGINRSGVNPNDLFDAVVAADRMQEVLPETDILILSLPGTADTFRIIGEKELALLPDGALVVNVGRGTCIDQKEMEKELCAGRLFAALDVFETEPIPADDTFWDCPNLLITPHVAGDTSLPYTLERIVALFLDDFKRYAKGEALRRPVDITKGY